MELTNSLNSDINHIDPGKADGDASEVKDLKNSVIEMSVRIDKLEISDNEVEQFYSTEVSSTVKGKDRERHFSNLKLQLKDASQREAAALWRMQKSMRQFATMLRQVIDKPMDIGTIKTKMEAKDGTGYKNVCEIYADVRLVFKNAMKYNDEKDDVHVMAKILLEKFEEKWLQLLLKVSKEEAAYASMARDTRNELYDLDMQMRQLKETVVKKCRRMSTEEKRNLGAALTQLSPEDLSKALEIVAENNPSFRATAQEVDLDIDAQGEYTLWRLKVFVKEALKVEGNSGSNNTAANNSHDDNKKKNSKRRREIWVALAKTTVKRTKKLANLLYIPFATSLLLVFDT